MKDLIIRRPDLQPKGSRVLGSAVTLVAWFIWFYMWLPLVSLLGWVFGVRLFIEYMMIDDPHSYFPSLLLYLIVGLLLALSMVGWSLYNLKRYGSRERRKHAPRAKVIEIARFFKMGESELAVTQRSRIAIIELSPDGQIEQVTPLPLSLAVSDQLKRAGSAQSA